MSSRLIMQAKFPLLALSLLGLTAACDGGPAIDTGIDTDPADERPDIDMAPCDIDFGVVENNTKNSQAIAFQNAGSLVMVQRIETSAAVFEPAHGTLPAPVEAGGGYNFTLRYYPVDDYAAYAGEDLTVYYTEGEAGTEELSYTCQIAGAVITDLDNDGYDAVAAGGDDCDDERADVNIGEDESWYDGVDNDCSGGSDFDQDGDGYESAVFNDDPAAGGGDCVDVNVTINPGVEDIWYDGIDSNCDGINDFDQDGDGYRSEAYGWDDCDDLDPVVNPDGAEVFNGKDDDCNGIPDDGTSADDADAIITGDDATDHAGNSLAVGDWDDSGVGDFAMAVQFYNYSATSAPTGDAQGLVAIWLDGSETDYDTVQVDADILIEGDGSTDEFGSVLQSIGDVDDDGLNDFAVSAMAHSSRAGIVYVFTGSEIYSGATLTTASAIFTVAGGDDDELGGNITHETDFDADGVDDLIVWGADAQLPYLYLGIQYGDTENAGSYAWSEIDATWRNKCGGTSGTNHTQTLCAPPQSAADPDADWGGTDAWLYGQHGELDLDGDGYPDLAAGDQYYDDDGYKNGGAAYVLWGRSTHASGFNASFAGTATTIAAGTFVKDFVGKLVTAVDDMDGDGQAELLVYSGKAETLYLMYGSTDLRTGGFTLADDADAAFEGLSDDITGVANAGDWTGDGYNDVLFSFGGSGTTGEVVLLGSDAWSGVYDFDDEISGSIEGGDYNYAFGLGIPQVMGDMNGDGKIDLVVGDVDYDDDAGGGSPNELGSAHIFYNSL